MLIEETQGSLIPGCHTPLVFDLALLLLLILILVLDLALRREL